MSSPATAYQSVELFDLLRRQHEVRERSIEEAREQLSVALRDIALKQFSSAGYALRNALLLRPFDPQTRVLFRDTERDWRTFYYDRQSWHECYYRARIAAQTGDLTAATAALAALEEFDPGLASSAADLLDAQDLGNSVRSQMAALNAVCRIVSLRLKSGPKARAQGLCLKYLLLAPQYEPLLDLARLSGLPVAGEPHAPPSPPLSLPNEPEILAEIKEPHNFRYDCFADLLSAGVPRAALEQLLLHSDAGSNRQWVPGAAEGLIRIGKLLRDDRTSEALQQCDAGARRYVRCTAFRQLWVQIEAKIACADWEQRQDLLDRLESEPDLRARSSLVAQALERFADDPLFVRELQLIENEQQLSALTHRRAIGWPAHTVEPPPHTPPPPPNETSQPGIVRTGIRRAFGRPLLIFACGTACSFLLFLMVRAHRASIPYAPVESVQARSAVAAGMSFPIKVLTRVPVAFYLDYKPLNVPRETSKAIAITVPPGDHVLSVAHGAAMVHLSTQYRDGHPQAELHGSGLRAVLLSGNRFSIAQPGITAFLDGRRVDASSTYTALAISSGKHSVAFGGQLFTFEPTTTAAVLFIGSEPEASSSKATAPDQRSQPQFSNLQATVREPVPGQLNIAPPPDVDLGPAQSVNTVLPLQPPAAIPLPLAKAPAHVNLPPIKERNEDADQIRSVLKRYADAWNAKDAVRIASLRPGLSRQWIKTDLNNVRAIAMVIQPIGEPRIDGNSATVECMHQITQTLPTGVKKKNPTFHVKYLLHRKGKSWIIDRME